MARLRQIFIHLDGGPIFRPFFPIRPTFLHVCQPIEKKWFNDLLFVIIHLSSRSRAAQISQFF